MAGGGGSVGDARGLGDGHHPRILREAVGGGGWSAHDVANAAGRAFKLPPELFEKNVWQGDGTRTVFTDADGNVVM